MITIKSQEELESYIKDDCITIDDDLTIEIDVSIDASIRCKALCAMDIKARDINARNIDAGNINAGDINARNIDAGNINAGDINARNIDAGNINYYAVCFAYTSFICETIVGRRVNHKHFCLDGEIIERGEK